MSIHPFLWVLIFAAAIAVMVILISFLVGMFVSVAGHRYGEKLQNRYQKKICLLLPGKNCGECGCESCDGFARAVLFGAVAEDACPYVQAESVLAAVNEMLKLMEDPKPPKENVLRRKTIWEKKQ